MDAPALLAGDLQDEDVVGVVVGREALRLARRDVGVDLDRVPEVGDQLAGEVHQRRPHPVQPLQDEGVAVDEQVEQPVVDDLVRDLRAGPSASCVARRRHHGAALGDAQEWRPEAAP
jgi:hypothetical protein